MIGTGVFGVPAAHASDSPVLDWVIPNANSGHAPLAIVISQPEPALTFNSTGHARTVQLEITPQFGQSQTFTTRGGNSLWSGLASETFPHTLELPSAAESRALQAQSGLFGQTPQGPTWSVTVEVEQELAASLTAIGQIRCRDGFFSPAGYTASGCEPVTSQGERLRLGGSLRPTDGIEFDLGLFQQNANSGPLSQQPVEQGLYNSSLLSSPLSAGQYIEAHSGIDMGVHVNTSESALGRFQLDLGMAEYFNRNQDAAITAYDFKAPWLGQADLQRQTRLHLGWSKGSFSGGVEGIYQVYQPGLLNTPGNDWSTFNLYFSWQAPWNGRFSIGATNVLDSSLEDTNSQQPDPRQPLDGIFGRVPYVRYKHDL